MSDESELPDGPFAAARLTTTTVYHTGRCPAVSRAGLSAFVALTDSEMEYHDLSHCRFCSGAYDGPAAAGRQPTDWLPDECRVESETGHDEAQP